MKTLLALLMVLTLATAITADTTTTNLGKIAYAGPLFLQGDLLFCGGLGIPLGDAIYLFTTYRSGGTINSAGEEIVKFFPVPKIGDGFLDYLLPEYIGPLAGGSLEYGTVNDHDDSETAYLAARVGGAAVWHPWTWGGFAGYFEYVGDFDNTNKHIDHIKAGGFVWMGLDL